MPLFDFSCRKCQFDFEQLARSPDDPEAGVCPKCGAAGAEKKVPKFRVGGRGDLRESTDFHGCHPSVEAASTESAHTCSGGCSHGKAAPSGSDS